MFLEYIFGSWVDTVYGYNIGHMTKRAVILKYLDFHSPHYNWTKMLSQCRWKGKMFSDLSCLM